MSNGENYFGVKVAEIMKAIDTITDTASLRYIGEALNDRMRYLHSVKQFDARAKFHVGDKVSFIGTKFTGKVTGKIVKMNPKSAIVMEAERTGAKKAFGPTIGLKWSVPYSSLMKEA